MAIPSSYRLLEVSDVGKYFGRDLSVQVFIDTTINPLESLSISEFNQGHRTARPHQPTSHHR